STEEESCYRGRSYQKSYMSFHLHPLRNYNYVTRLQQDILFRLLAVDCVFVIEGKFHLFAIFDPQDVDVLELGKLCEPARARKRLQNGHVRQQRKGASSRDFSRHVNPPTINFRYSYGHLWIINIFC